MHDIAMQKQLAEASGPLCTGPPQPLRAMFTSAARKYPENTAVTSLYQRCMPGVCNESPNTKDHLSWTYQQLDEASNLLATVLRTRGIGKGMRIAAFLFNSAEWALLFWSSLKLGAVFVSLDARSVARQEEVQHYLRVIEPAVLVVGDDSAAATIQRNNALDLPDSVLRLVVSSGKPILDKWASLHDILVKAGSKDKKGVPIDEVQLDTMEDVVLIVFTSGTSGLPKACPHTNKTLWTTYHAVLSLRPFWPSDVVAQHLPPSHIFACLDMVQCWSDAATVVYTSQNFDAKATLEAIEKLQCTYISGKSTIRALICRELQPLIIV